MRSLAKLIAIAVLATTPAAIAGAQGVTSMTKPFSLGISGGVAIPTSDLSNGYNTGYNVSGHVTYGNPTFPFQIRGDIGYNAFDAKSGTCPSGQSCNAHALGFTGNLVYEFPTPGAQVRPYLIGGAGVYNVNFSRTLTSGNFTNTSTNSENDFGFNLGGGFVIPLSGLNAFVEAKYTQVNFSGANLKFVPITFGVMF